jgi:hypothetical protein
MRAGSTLLILFSFLLTLMAAVELFADSSKPQELTVVNAGFEEKDSAGMPVGWISETSLPAGNSVYTDTGFKHSGNASLLVDSITPASVTFSSGLVEMEVGFLYRLSGWIKTESAFSDPTSHYPTAVPACLTMLSFPFTNHSPAVGATRDWTEIEVLFIATKKKDRVRVNFGFNGTATGRAWFDDLKLEKVEEISRYIPMETVTWFGPAYRYDDRGWIFVHIEGEPYERGYQYGFLTAEEIVEYISKLGCSALYDPGIHAQPLRGGVSDRDEGDRRRRQPRRSQL